MPDPAQVRGAQADRLVVAARDGDRHEPFPERQLERGRVVRVRVSAHVEERCGPARRAVGARGRLEPVQVGQELGHPPGGQRAAEGDGTRPIAGGRPGRPDEELEQPAADDHGVQRDEGAPGLTPGAVEGLAEVRDGDATQPPARVPGLHHLPERPLDEPLVGRGLPERGETHRIRSHEHVHPPRLLRSRHHGSGG